MSPFIGMIMAKGVRFTMHAMVVVHAFFQFRCNACSWRICSVETRILCHMLPM